MLELKKLVLKNFKSFRSAEIPFKKGLTAIIGPNGSGKSNILDALLFVLGETSMKSLRMGRITELINYDAAEKYAKVELKLKRDEEVITISRLIDWKGRSECRINDKKVTLNELVSLVEELGLKNKYNFFVQGDVTRIIEMSPEQRRTIIDELAGIKEFELKRAEAQENLDKVNERIKNVKLVLQERLSRLETLQKEREQAERYKSLVERKNMLKASIIKSELDSIQMEIEKKKTKLKKCQEDIEKRADEKLRIIKRIDELEKKAEEITRKIVEEQQKVFQEFGEKAEKLRTDIRIAEESINAYNATMEKLSNQENSLGEEIRSLLAQMEDEKKNISANEEELDELNEEIQRLEDEIKGFEEKAKEASQVRAEVEKEIGEIEAEIEKLQKEINAKQKELGEVKRENEMRQQRIQELAEESKELENTRKIFAKLREQLQTLEGKGLEEKLSKFKIDEKKLRTKESELLGRIEELKSELSELEKASAKCPVCDSPISADKKKILFEKKSKELKTLEQQRKELIGNIEAYAEKIQTCEKELSKLLELRHELKGYEDRIKLLEKLEQQIKEEEKKIKDIGAISNEIAKLEQEIRKYQQIRMEKKASLDKLVDARDSKRYAELTEMIHKRSMLESTIQISEGHVANISSECEKIRARLKELAEEKQSLQKSIESKTKSIDALKQELAKLEDARMARSGNVSELLQEKDNISNTIQKLKTELNLLEAEIGKLEKEVNEIRVELGKGEVRLADLEEELKEMPQTEFISDVPIKDMKKSLAEIEKELASIGPVNLRASESLREEEEQLLEVKEKIEKLEEEQKAVLEMIEKIEVKKKELFMSCLEAINKNFSDMFYRFFGGTGKLSLTDYENIKDAGLIIEAKHKESLQSIDAMSGGEKTLTALAFIFAVLLYKPAPLYFFDETDAALDEVNSIKVSQILNELSKKAQIIVITHNNVVIRYAMQVIGVTLSKNKSSIIGLDLSKHMENGNNANEAQKTEAPKVEE